MTGYTLAEASGRDVRFLSGPETDPAAIEKIADAYRDGKECTVEVLAYRKDGSTSLGLGRDLPRSRTRPARSPTSSA